MMEQKYVIVEEKTLRQLLLEFSELRSELNNKLKEPANTESKVSWLTREEVAIKFKKSIRTIDNWTELGILHSYEIATSIYYKEDELDNLPKRKSSKF